MIPKLMNDDWPRISLVIPTLNQGKFIEETLKILKNNDFEIIAFSNNNLGADDATTERLKEARKHRNKKK